MAPLEMVLRTTFVAVPALRRVEPVSASGPTLGRISTSHVSTSTRGGSEHETSPVVAPIVWARDNAPRAYGVGPLAAMPSTKSAPATRARAIAALPAVPAS